MLAEFFQKEKWDLYKDCFVESEFIDLAEKAGFTVEYHRDITDNVAPTFEVGQIFMGYGQRLFTFATDSAARRAPVKWWLARLFYGHKLEKVRDLLYDKLPLRLDIGDFKAKMRYAMYRLTRKG